MGIQAQYGFFDAGFSALEGIIWFVLFVVTLAGLWKIFEKAGHEGWKAIIPIYNIYIILQIVGRPWWWLLLLLIPFVNIIIGVVVAYDLARSFGKGVGFTLGLIFLGFIFYPILGFGDATYRGPHAASGVGHEVGPRADLSAQAAAEESPESENSSSSQETSS